MRDAPVWGAKCGALQPLRAGSPHNDAEEESLGESIDGRARSHAAPWFTMRTGARRRAAMCCHSFAWGAMGSPAPPPRRMGNDQELDT